MRQAAIEQDGLHLTVRYFAAARAAAGTESEIVILSPGTTVAELVQRLARSGTRLTTVLNRSSYLCGGIAVRDKSKALQSGDTIDVLPPFAGG